MSGEIEIFPKALVTAARAFAKKPAVVGEVLVALVAESDGVGVGKALSEVQRYVIAACREEMEELAARREAAAERKRRQRSRAIAGAEQDNNRKGTK